MNHSKNTSALIATTLFVSSFTQSDAVVQYFGTDGGDWDTPADWVSGNATAAGDNAEVNAGRTANITTTITTRTNTTIIGNNQNGTSTLIVRNGGSYIANNTAAHLHVGGNRATFHSDGIFTVESGGLYRQINGNLEIGDSTRGTKGTVTFESGSSFDLRNGDININNGILRFENGVGTNPNTYQIKENFYVSDNGILEFQTVGSSISTLVRTTETRPRLLTLSTGSILSMELTGAHTVGDSWTLMTNVQTFDGTFGSIVDSTAGHEGYVFTADYGSATANQLSVTLTAVPEPSSAALLSLGGLAFILRRRK